MLKNKGNHCDVGDYIRIKHLRAEGTGLLVDEGLVIDIIADSEEDPGVVSILAKGGRFEMYDLASLWVVIEKVFTGSTCKL